MKRSAPIHQTARKDLPKRVKLGIPSKTTPRIFSNVGDIRTALQSNEVEEVIQALTTLRNQLLIHIDEDAPLLQDERILLTKTWLENSPGAQDVFSIIGRAPKPSAKVSSLCLTVLAAILNLLSTHFVYHTLGKPVIKTLLSPPHMRQLNANLSHKNSDMIISTLKLFNAMSNFAGGMEKRSILDGFPWGQRSLHKLLFLRRKSMSFQDTYILDNPDIRTLYISFILSFLSNMVPPPVKISFLEQHKDLFLLIFKGIFQDPYVITRQILEVCWEGIWSDSKIKRTLKIGLFNEPTFDHLLKLYDRDAPEDNTTGHVPADMVHQFMLAVMTRPGVGICFKSRGWYPRDKSLEEITGNNADPDAELEAMTGQGGRIYNKILGNIMKSLKVNEDPRQQELAFRILEACPELVAGYWPTINLTLEPRLSSRWITNISVLGNVISLPVPTSSFLLPQSTHYNPSPPPLSSVTANILPSVLNKTHLTKGLQSSSILVQHCTALTLSKCLIKLDRVLRIFREVSHNLEEDSENGQWLRCSRELENEIERKVPDFMVIVAMVLQKRSLGLSSCQVALLTESALRLLWLYHKLFPRLVSEVRFDVGKLLMGVFVSIVPSFVSTNDGEIDTDTFLLHRTECGLDILRQLHVVRLLVESDQFTWSSKLAASPHSHLYAIFTLYTKTSHPIMRNATSDLLKHTLSPSILFSHDPLELDLWLSALPLTQRSADAIAPDGTPLTDESTSVLTFVDDCIQRCLKTPYRYLENGTTFFNQNAHLKNESSSPQDPSVFPSPLLMTILEQLRAKSVANLLSPSDILAIVTFIRKLTCALTTKMRDLQSVWAIWTRLDEIVSIPAVAPNSIVMQKAIRRESDLLSRALKLNQNPRTHSPTPCLPIQKFLTQVESLSIPSSEVASSNAAYKLVDWMRLIHLPFHHTEIDRLLKVIIRFSPSAATEFFYQIDPQSGYMWSGFDDRTKILEESIPFEWAHLHSTPEQLLQTNVKEALTSLFFSSKRAWNSSLERRVSTCMHRLAKGNGMGSTLTSLRQAELSLLGSIMRRGHSQPNNIDLTQLKHALFSESESIRELYCSKDISNVELVELSGLVEATLQPHISSDREIALGYCNFWISESETYNSLRTYTLTSPWIPFMEPMNVIKHLDTIVNALEDGQLLDDTDQITINVVLDTLIQFSTNAQVLKTLQCRIHGLIAIRPSLHKKTALDTLLLLVIDSRFPLGYNALSLPLVQTPKVSDITFSAQERWDIRSAPLPLDSTLMTTLLDLKDWDENIARIISGIIYNSSSARRMFWAWLFKTEPAQSSSLSFFVIPLHAYLDIMTFQSDERVNRLPDTWFVAIVRYLFQAGTSDVLRTLCASCIWLVFQVYTTNREHYITHLVRELQNGNGTLVNPHSIRLLRDLHRRDITTFSPVLIDITEKALEWMVHQFSGHDISEDEFTVLHEISQLAAHVEMKAYLVEPVFKAAIQNCLHIPNVIKSLPPLMMSAHLKPAAGNRCLQSIVQHSHLYSLGDPSHPSRQPIIELLHTLFHIHPINTCQPTHVAPLTRLYGGTLSLSDRLLFSIFYLYERQRKESVASIFRNWSPTPSAPPPQDIIQAITSLDPAKVFRTCTAFPTRRQLDGNGHMWIPIDCEDELYDPAFLTLLVVQLVLEHKVLSSTGWVQVFRSNIVSLVICVFTSRNENFRNVGVTAIAGLLQRIQEADFMERGQVIYIMNILRDLLPRSLSTSSAPRLPTYSVILLAHALRAIFYPSSFLYPLVSRFLLQRPELDTTDVPMLYSLLYSSEDGVWVRERTWMIRFLCVAISDGGAQDWKMLRRRHTWDLVASMWQATRPEERSLRKAVLEFLANLSLNRYAINSLILHSSLLTWIEMQLETRTASDGESIAWVKILENIIVTAFRHTSEKATPGEFHASLSRSLYLLTRTITVSDIPTLTTNIGLLQRISRVMLRIAANPSGRSNVLADLLQHTSHVLQSFEPLLLWRDEAKTRKHCSPATIALQPPLHRARGLFDTIETSESITDNTRFPLCAWAEIVSTLWRVAMALDSPSLPVDIRTWDILTCRLLLLRASPWFASGSRNENNIEEWVRRETLAFLLKGGGGEREVELNQGQ